MKKIKMALLTACMVSAGVFCTSQKNTTGVSTEQVSALIAGQSYRFKAENVIPMGGKTRILTSDYIFNVTPDMVDVDLPYFGKAYTAPMNPADAGIRFTSRNFSYQKTDRAKGGWDIVIQPKDVPDIRECRLTVFDNGSTTAMVNSNSKQTITYTGYITPLPVKK